MACDYKFGCHECMHRLLFLHAQIRQYLHEPNGNNDKLRAEVLSVKRFIEDIVGVGETENDRV